MCKIYNIEVLFSADEDTDDTDEKEQNYANDNYCDDIWAEPTTISGRSREHR